MPFSPLTAYSVPTEKYSSRYGTPVSRLIVHHTAGGTDDGNVALLSTGARDVSANYCLLTTAELVGIVPEEYRAWTSGSPAADNPSITVETVNTSGGPDWLVSDAQLERLAQLAADLCTRYGWGSLDRNRVIGHRQVAQTACPGPYLYPRLDAIVARGNEILANGGTGEDEMNSEQAGMLKAVYDALFKETPTSRGSSAGVLKVLGQIEGLIRATYDAQFKETETSRGTPGGTLVNDRIMLAKLDAIIAHFDIPVELPKPEAVDALPAPIELGD